ncbi:MAG: hypothetical protein ACPGTG_01120 [Flavobacteriales bacterium]
MKIHYSKKHLKKQLVSIYLFFGLALTICLCLYFLGYDVFSSAYLGLWIGALGPGTAALFMYLAYYKNYFLSIENGSIQKNTMFSKPIKLADIEHVKVFSGDYILKNKTKTIDFVIDTQLIETESLEKLNMELKKLTINWS